MKSTFARQFSLIAGLVLLCVAFLGAGFRALMYNNLVSQERDALEMNASAVAQLAAAYDTTGELENNWDFRMSLTFAADVGENDLVVADRQGTIVTCSCPELHCGHIGMTLNQALVTKVMDNQEVYDHGMLTGLYDGERYYVAVPILPEGDSQPTGLVLVSSQDRDIEQVLTSTFEMFFFTAAVVLLIALAATSILAKNEAEQLGRLTEVAHRFGRGDFQARAPVDNNSTIEINELAKAFNAMAISLEQAELQRREFVANVSHELKTPMTTIAGFMDGMLDGTIPPERHRQYMKTVSEEVRRLSRLVRSMLDISTLQAQGTPETKKQRFNLTESVGQILLTFEKKITDKNIEVEADFPDKPVFVWADMDAISQVLSNLTDNAVKFCQEGGDLWVRVIPEGGKARVVVGNSGKTIPPLELPLLFDRFHKLDKSRSKDRDGYGLGLYIVKTIMDSHGADIAVTSENGRTEFSFTLPIKK